MMEHNVGNGIPTQIPKPSVLSQERSQFQINGVQSSQSSRSSSPSTRLINIPSSQLPPVRPPIPQTQLPPNKINSDVGPLTQKISQLSVSHLVTPNLSPAIRSSPQDVPLSQQRNQPQSCGEHNLSPVSKPDLKNNFGNTASSSYNICNIQDNIAVTDINYSSNFNIAPSPNINNSNERKTVSSSMKTQQTFGYSAFDNTNNQVSYDRYRSFPPLGNINELKNSVVQPSVGNSSSVRQCSSNNQNNSLIPRVNPHFSPGPQYQQLNLPKHLPAKQVYEYNDSDLLQQKSFQGHTDDKVPEQQNGPVSGPVDQQHRPNVHSNRYPHLVNHPHSQQHNFQSIQQGVYLNQNTVQHQQSIQQPGYRDVQQPYQGVATSGFSKYWGTENYDLLQNPNILPTTKIEPPKIILGNEVLNEINCSPDIIRCTMTKIPENNSLLQKSRLPLGILIHPFKDLTHLNVVSCNVIVRCRACRTYINPFVYFVDNKRWKCNLCYRVNELPEEFMYDPYTKSYGDPSRRPEIKTSTIEYIAPAEYMLRPPQPAVYLYLLDISRLAVESGYLSLFCQLLLDELQDIPGDSRTQIGFIAFDSALHFYSLAEGLSQPHEMIVLDIEDVFLPTTYNLLVNLKDRFELVTYLLQHLPTRYNQTFDNNSALGAALQVAYKLMGATGGRVTVFQASLPNIGPGALTSREDPSQRASAEVSHLNPANDFYKRLALECSSQQIAVDLFLINSQYVDIATISGISRFSGGCIYHFPLFKVLNSLQVDEFEKKFRRYLTRKIGFEAVMRVRCTRGLAIHTFHGNFFVRSTDLLSLPNVNPDAGFGMQVSIEENLSDVQTVCFQAALLYTSSKGERRIRVHTICLPVVATVHDIIHSADQEAIVGLLAKMAVDRSMQSSLSDAREAFINVAVDILSSYKLTLNLGSPVSGLLAPSCLRVLPLYISALLRHTAFKTGVSIRLDDRVKAMIDMKTKPLSQLISMIYPALYPIHNLEEQEVILDAEEEPVAIPPKFQLTSRCLDSKGAFLMDTGDQIIILVCPNVSEAFLRNVLGVQDYSSITDQMYEIPVLDNLNNQRLHQFIRYLNDDRPFPATLQIIRDNSPLRITFFGRLIEDRADNALSYHEFLQHLKSQVK